MDWRIFAILFIECPVSEDGMERFACPTADRMGRYHCIDDHVLCDGFLDCPTGEDEDRQACMFYKTVSKIIWQFLSVYISLTRKNSDEFDPFYETQLEYKFFLYEYRYFFALNLEIILYISSSRWYSNKFKRKSLQKFHLNFHQLLKAKRYVWLYILHSM